MKNIILLGDLKFLTIIFLGGVTIPKKNSWVVYVSFVFGIGVMHWNIVMYLQWKYDDDMIMLYILFMSFSL